MWTSTKFHRTGFNLNTLGHSGWQLRDSMCTTPQSIHCDRLSSIMVWRRDTSWVWHDVALYDKNLKWYFSFGIYATMIKSNSGELTSVCRSWRSTRRILRGVPFIGTPIMALTSRPEPPGFKLFGDAFLWWKPAKKHNEYSSLDYLYYHDVIQKT